MSSGSEARPARPGPRPRFTREEVLEAALRVIDREPPEKSGEISNILISCELGNILIEGIRGATADGGELTKESFIAAVESITDLPGQGWINTISFSADDHTAPADVREVTWDTACPCWKASSDWMPISDFE